MLWGFWLAWAGPPNDDSWLLKHLCEIFIIQRNSCHSFLPKTIELYDVTLALYNVSQKVSPQIQFNMDQFLWGMIYCQVFISHDKFWAHFKVELKLVKSSYGDFLIMGFIWLSYSTNDTFSVSKFLKLNYTIFTLTEKTVSWWGLELQNIRERVFKNVNPIPFWLD